MTSSLFQPAAAATRTSATSAASSIGSTTGLNSGSSAPSGATEALGGAAISSFAQFLSKLQNLKQTNPAKEKQVLGDIADKLNAQAKSAATPDASQRLSKMADRFSQAAQSGDLSSLQSQAQSSSSSGGGALAARARSAYQQASGVGDSLMDVLQGEQL